MPNLESARLSLVVGSNDSRAEVAKPDDERGDDVVDLITISVKTAGLMGAQQIRRHADEMAGYL
jgi:hypothetical protein